MRSGLIYYNPIALVDSRREHREDIDLFSNYFKIYGYGVVPIDRTGTITFPIRTTSLFPMPAFRAYERSFEDTCNERARELLARAGALRVPLYIFWSGGVDSTLALISLLKHATDTERKNITVLLSDESITEYPRFYAEHVRGKLNYDSAALFPRLLGGSFLFVNGEHNDQVFGSDAVGRLVTKFGEDVIHMPFDRKLFFDFFNDPVENAAVTNFFLDLIERLVAAAPVKVRSNYDVLWWINFSLKWQTVFMRTLAHVSPQNASKLTRSYIETNYAPFYNTENFQQWSMNNLDKRIRDTWKSYKWVCKDIIYEYTKDADYRDNKTKRGSLQSLIAQHPPINFITDEFEFLDDMDTASYAKDGSDFAGFQSGTLARVS